MSTNSHPEYRDEPMALKGAEARVPTLEAEQGWESIFQGRVPEAVQEILPTFLLSRRWFGGKARRIRSVRASDTLCLPTKRRASYVLLLKVEYYDHSEEMYALPLTYAAGERARTVEGHHPSAVFVRLHAGGEQGVLYDALWDEDTTRSLLDAIAHRRSFEGQRGRLDAWAGSALAGLIEDQPVLKPTVSRAEQSNTSVFYDQRLILKVFRRLEAGVNPDLEVGRFLTERAHFANTPAAVGALEYREGTGAPVTCALLQRFVANEGDAWKHVLDSLGHYFQRAVESQAEIEAIPTVARHPLALLDEEPPAPARELIGPFLEQARLLGQRTAELHLALASDRTDPDFAPEAFTDDLQRTQYRALRDQVTQVLPLLRDQMRRLPEDVQPAARSVLHLEGAIIERFADMRDRRLTAMRIRTHGDYHLGQVLYTGDDFFIIDFEGEPARSLSERRAKSTVLRDVAGMVRSLHYASFAGAFSAAESGAIPGKLEEIERWRVFWYGWIASAFLGSYLAACGSALFLPQASDELRLLLDIYVLDKAVYELGYELNNRPGWVRIPLQGILEIMRTGEVQ